MNIYIENLQKILYQYFSIPLKVFIVAIFLLQVGALFSVATQQMDVPAVIEVNSLDAAKGVETLKNTNFFNDNLWRAYGPLYYRLSYLSFNFNKNMGVVNYANEIDTLNIKLSYSLITVSTLSLIFSSLLISYCINRNIYINLICSSLIIYYLLTINDVVHLLFWNHPDLLLAFFGVALYYFFIKYNQQPTYRNLIYVGIIGGLGFLTKVSFFILYIPVFTILFISYRRIKLLFILVLITIVSYFIIGSPQSFEIRGILNFLKEQNAYRDVVSLNSIIFWITELFKDLYKPVIIIFILVICFSDKEGMPGLVNSNALWSGLFLLPVLILSTISFAHSPSYYVVPLVFSFLPIAALIFKEIINSPLINNIIYQKFLSKLNYIGVIFFIFHISFYNLIPNNFFDISNSILIPRASVKETIGFVTKLPIGSSKIKTAYFPSSDPSVPSIDGIVSVNKFISSGEAKFLLISKSWYARYFKSEPSKYDLGGESYEHFKSMSKFWAQFNNDNHEILVNGNLYRLIYESGNDRVYELILK